MTANSAPNAWDPERYARFRDERAQPFYDLAALLDAPPGPRVLDLGCGDGALTAWLHRRLQARDTLGIDHAPAMLAAASAHAGDGLRFEQADIATFAPSEPFDVVFSNAALQWLPDHPALLARLASWLAPGGQLAMQMPANDRAVTHTRAAALAREQPYAGALGGYVVDLRVLAPEQYAALLFRLGCAEQHVRLQVYPHVLPGPEAAVDWIRGTLLTAYEARMPAALFARFLAEYERRLLATLGDQRPLFFGYPRLLIWGRWP